MFLHVYMYTYIHVYMYIHMYLCIYIYIHTHIYTHICIYIYIYYTCIYIYTDIYIHKYIYSYTPTPSYLCADVYKLKFLLLFPYISFSICDYPFSFHFDASSRIQHTELSLLIFLLLPLSLFLPFMTAGTSSIHLLYNSIL